MSHKLHPHVYTVKLGVLLSPTKKAYTISKKQVDTIQVGQGIATTYPKGRINGISWVPVAPNKGIVSLNGSVAHPRTTAPFSVLGKNYYKDPAPHNIVPCGKTQKGW